MSKLQTLFPGARTFAAAQDDDVDDDLADVEGDSEGDETAVLEEGGDEDQKEDGKSGGSPDAGTTILFTKPIIIPGSNLGE